MVVPKWLTWLGLSSCDGHSCGKVAVSSPGEPPERELVIHLLERTDAEIERRSNSQHAVLGVAVTTNALLAGLVVEDLTRAPLVLVMLPLSVAFAAVLIDHHLNIRSLSAHKSMLMRSRDDWGPYAGCSTTDVSQRLRRINGPGSPQPPVRSSCPYPRVRRSGVPGPTMTAGGSAQREYERRKAKQRAAIRRNLVWTVPLLIALSVAGGVLVERFVGSFGWAAGLLIAAGLGLELWGTSSNITAYGIGAEGERLTGRVLDKLDGYVVLHDRKIPGSKANIDHIAIGPGGVFVVGTKNADRRGIPSLDGGAGKSFVDIQNDHQLYPS